MHCTCLSDVIGPDELRCHVLSTHKEQRWFRKQRISGSPLLMTLDIVRPIRNIVTIAQRCCFYSKWSPELAKLKTENSTSLRWCCLSFSCLEPNLSAFNAIIGHFGNRSNPKCCDIGLFPCRPFEQWCKHKPERKCCKHNFPNDNQNDAWKDAWSPTGAIVALSYHPEPYGSAARSCIVLVLCDIYHGRWRQPISARWPIRMWPWEVWGLLWCTCAIATG